MTDLVSKQSPVDDEPNTILIDLFGNSPEVRLLDFFLDHPINDFMQMELAERTGMNKRTVKRVIDKMLDIQTIVVTRKIGKAVLYRLNHESEAVKSIRDLEEKVSTMAALKAPVLKR